MARSWRTKKDRAAGAERGFTFVEVLIATAIFSFSIAALFAVYSNTVVASEAARDRATARLHIQSLLSELGVTKPLRDGVMTGDFGDGYAWRLEIEPYGTSAERAASLFAAWDITASVEWRRRGKARSVRLSTIRLGGEAG